MELSWKINFLGIGAAKCGTTALHEQLNAHPEVSVPSEKETEFFTDSKKFTKGIEGLRSYFKKAEDKCCGEITPSYIYDRRVPRRVFEMIGPDIKIIVMLRNPVERAYSHYCHMRALGLEPLSFRDALDAEAERLKKSEKARRAYSYVDRSRYSAQIEEWYRWFPKENFFIILFESDWIKNHMKTNKQLHSFIGVRPISFNFEGNANKGYQPFSIKINKVLFVIAPKFKFLYRIVLPSKTIRRKILFKISQIGKKPLVKLEYSDKKEIYQKFFSDDVERLETILDRDLSGWKL